MDSPIYEIATFETCPRCGVPEHVAVPGMRLFLIHEDDLPGKPTISLVGWQCDDLVYGTVLGIQATEPGHEWPGTLPQESHHHVFLAQFSAKRRVEPSYRLDVIGTNLYRGGNLVARVVLWAEQRRRETERLHRRESIREVQ